MKEKVENLKLEVAKKLEATTNLKEVNDLKVEYLGKKGPVQELTSHMKELSSEEKREFGMLLNSLKQELTSTIDAKIKYYEEEALNQKLASEKIDVTLPATTIPVGAPNILEKIIEEVEEVFMSMGYDVVDGPEIEEDKYNFELLNIPKGHPARDAQDTYPLPVIDKLTGATEYTKHCFWINNTYIREIFKEDILYGALNPISYDIYFEGTKCWYIYDLILGMQDNDYFENKIMSCYVRILFKS